MLQSRLAASETHSGLGWAGLAAELGLQGCARPQGKGGRERGHLQGFLKGLHSSRPHIPSLHFPALSPLGSSEELGGGTEAIGLEVGLEGEAGAATAPGRPQGGAQPSGLGSEGRAFLFLPASSQQRREEGRRSEPLLWSGLLPLSVPPSPRSHISLQSSPSPQRRLRPRGITVRTQSCSFLNPGGLSEGKVVKSRQEGGEGTTECPVREAPARLCLN